MRKVLFLLSIFFLVASCEKVAVKDTNMAESTDTPEATEEQPATTVMTPGTVATITIGDAAFSVEVADSDPEKAKGLMDRESLPANNGMWFVFSDMGNEKFWMKNTLIPLDMIFVDDGMKIVHIRRNAAPESIELYTAPVPFQYVLEVNAGVADAKGIEEGDMVELRIGQE